MSWMTQLRTLEFLDVSSTVDVRWLPHLLTKLKTAKLLIEPNLPPNVTVQDLVLRNPDLLSGTEPWVRVFVELRSLTFLGDLDLLPANLDELKKLTRLRCSDIDYQSHQAKDSDSESDDDSDCESNHETLQRMTSLRRLELAEGWLDDWRALLPNVDVVRITPYELRKS
eukprot:TRINITY_DN1794_c0_g1_i2.p2 TRINITY_DN1794_c0_g1~~TRINITY_DN1794_c0_g1_i2.p2  ORF type:complete len:169 (-),score=2.29 TRINITY_DN1794_c0_g1_i2:124-630(-)